MSRCQSTELSIRSDTNKILCTAWWALIETGDPPQICLQVSSGSFDTARLAPGCFSERCHEWRSKWSLAARLPIHDCLIPMGSAWKMMMTPVQEHLHTEGKLNWTYNNTQANVPHKHLKTQKLLNIIEQEQLLHHVDPESKWTNGIKEFFNMSSKHIVVRFCHHTSWEEQRPNSNMKSRSAIWHDNTDYTKNVPEEPELAGGELASGVWKNFCVLP